MEKINFLNLTNQDINIYAKKDVYKGQEELLFVMSLSTPIVQIPKTGTVLNGKFFFKNDENNEFLYKKVYISNKDIFESLLKENPNHFFIVTSEVANELRNIYANEPDKLKRFYTIYMKVYDYKKVGNTEKITIAGCLGLLCCYNEYSPMNNQILKNVKFME